ncbi:G-alpha-domain-containing protein, partial [Armillaria fumosa]
MPIADLHSMKPADDPFDDAPNPRLRIAREDAARRVSLAIDASIKAERQARRKKRIVRLLLLGQSESEFQRLYTPTAFREERILWRAVIQLNIVRSIRTILDASDNHFYRSQTHLPPPSLSFNELLTRLLPWKPKLISPDEDDALAGRSNSSSSGGRRRVSAGDIVAHSCRMDIMHLWADGGVRRGLKKKKIRLEVFPGLFLNDLERITSPKYVRTNDGVLKTRLKTVDAQVSQGGKSRIVDVRVSKNQHHFQETWVPFFDDVDAIIFLAPISGFDQVLSEDRTVNRLEDSVLLWKAVCQNKLLANVDLVLFLNKCDILESKLKAGIRLSKYVRSYGDRENDLDTVSKYLRSKFNAIHREYSPNPRKFYAFCTSVTVSACLFVCCGRGELMWLEYRTTATTAGIIAS